MPERLSVEVDGVSVEALVRLNPRARRITLRVDHTRRHAVLTAPAKRHLGRAERLLRENAHWLSRTLSDLPASVPFADGATIILRGTPHRIRHVDDAGRGEVVDKEIRVGGAPDALAVRIEALLRAEARSDLAAAAAIYAEALAVSFDRIRIGDPLRRWGSCSTSGTVSFSWRLVLAPPDVLDYVAAHEIAHLREMNHGPRFWAHVAALRPDWRVQSAWLKANGPQLHAVGRSG